MQHAFLTVDLGFGDAGKGSIVDFLTRAHGAHTVVRYNGGAQAAHRVVTPGPHPREHVFAQFGSGAEDLIQVGYDPAAAATAASALSRYATTQTPTAPLVVGMLPDSTTLRMDDGRL